MICELLTSGGNQVASSNASMKYKWDQLRGVFGRAFAHKGLRPSLTDGVNLLLTDDPVKAESYGRLTGLPLHTPTGSMHLAEAYTQFVRSLAALPIPMRSPAGAAPSGSTPSVEKQWHCLLKKASAPVTPINVPPIPTGVQMVLARSILGWESSVCDAIEESKSGRGWQWESNP